jgi:sugar-specific transcriptional regulator TrmB
MEIKQALLSMGLTEGESQVYLALINLGQCTTGKITKKASIASSKVYEVLQRLQIKGFVGYEIKNGTRYYDVTSPNRLLEFLEEKKENLSESQEQIKKIIPSIEEKRNQAEKHNQTVVYTGKQGPLIALGEILDNYKNGTKEAMGFGTDEDDYVKHFPAQLNNFFKESKKFKANERLLFAKGFKSPNKNANIRYLSKEFSQPIRTMISGDKVFIVDFTEPMTTIIIHKKEIAKAYKKHFEILWKIAKP